MKTNHFLKGKNMDTQSNKLFKKAQKVIPGGVNSPVRAFKSVGQTPVYIDRAQGAFLFDADGNQYLDFCGSWGPLILGHSHPVVVNAVQAASPKGLSYGACTEKEIEMAELLNWCVPYLEMVRLVNSGTEAVMSALRLARGYTGKTKIVKFDGCYHGHVDYMLLSAGSGLLTDPISDSAGVSDHAASEVVIAPYNDMKSLEEIFKVHGDDIAAVIVEPVAGNMGLIEPVKGFLEKIRSLTNKHKSLMILDEVITGFRFGPTTYGKLAGIEPDLTTLGKIIGGGMPIGAFGGKKKIMKKLAPLGPVYQAGTLSGNPIALAAGLTTLQTLIKEKPYKQLNTIGKTLEGEINLFAKEKKLDLCCASKGGAFTVFFRKTLPKNLSEVKECDTAKFADYHKKMLDNGFYLSPSQFELNFISTAHHHEDIEDFFEAFKNAVSKK